MPKALIAAVRRSHIWLHNRSTFDDRGAGPAETAAIIAGLVVAALGLVALVQTFTSNQSSVLGG